MIAVIVKMVVSLLRTLEKNGMIVVMVVMLVMVSFLMVVAIMQIGDDGLLTL